MTIPDVILHMAARPGNYFGDHYYNCCVAFLEGYNHASNDQLLAGFSEWLRSQVSDGSGYSWPRLLLRIECPELISNPRVWPLTPADHERAIRITVDKLIEYHAHHSPDSDGSA